MNYRIYVEKKPAFQLEAKSLKQELNSSLNLDVKTLRILNVYDLFGFTPELLEQAKYRVFCEIQSEVLYDSYDFSGKKYFAYELKPGQFDQRAAVAESCVKLLDPAKDIRVKTAKLLVFDDDLSEEDL